MVLNIDGVQKLKGHLFFNREIVKVASEEHFGSLFYVFYFNELPEYFSNPSITKWEDRFDIRLKREPINGMYELYWMGLHGVTCQQLHKSEIQNFQTFYSYFEKVIRLGKAYWEESKSYRT